MEDQGILSVQINEGFIAFVVEFKVDTSGFVNITITDCEAQVGSVNISVKDDPNFLYQTITTSWEHEAQEGLPRGTCSALEDKLASNITSFISNLQLQFMYYLTPESLTKYTIGYSSRVLVWATPNAIKILHDFGAIILLFFGLLFVYFVYELSRSLLHFVPVVFYKGKAKRKYSDAVDEIWVTSDSRLTTSIKLNDNFHKAQKGNNFVTRLRNIFWWRKTKDN